MTKKFIATGILMLFAAWNCLTFFMAFIRLSIAQYGAYKGHGGGYGPSGLLDGIFPIVSFIVFILFVMICYNGIMLFFTRNQNYYKYLVTPAIVFLILLILYFIGFPYLMMGVNSELFCGIFGCR
jgi:hypothetical protein